MDVVTQENLLGEVVNQTINLARDLSLPPIRNSADRIEAVKRPSEATVVRLTDTHCVETAGAHSVRLVQGGTHAIA